MFCFHIGGGKIVIFEYFADIPRAFDAFNNYKDLNGIKVNQCPTSGRLSYASIVQNYIMTTFKGHLASHPYTTCLTAKSFVNDMKKLNCWDEYCATEDEIDVTHPFLSQPSYIETVVLNASTALKTCMTFCDAHSVFCVKDSL